MNGSGANPTVLDLVGWGTAVNPETVATPAPKAGAVLTRNSNSDGVFIDTDNNAVDFSGDQDVSVRSTSTIKTNEVTISELLPNPASPIPDATGEFIELHNATELDIALRGFKLLTGSTLSHSYVFKDQVIAAHQYMAFYVTDTGTTLSNSGGKAQLQDRWGNIMSVVHNC